LLLKGGSEADPGKDANKQKNKTALVQVCKNLSYDDDCIDEDSASGELILLFCGIACRKRYWTVC